MQIAALEHIAKSAFSYNLPELIGEINQVKKDCKTYNICLFTYVEGNFISNIPFRKNKIIGVGRLVGELSSALQNFKYKKVRQSFEWDLQDLNPLIARVSHIKSKSKQDLIHFHIERYLKNVNPFLNSLTKSFIHNDGNMNNILLDEHGEASGIIDFGDMVHSFTVLEAAVCMSYLGQNSTNYLNNMFLFLKGFRSKFKLNQEEIYSALYMVTVRLCISLSIASWRKKLFPTNKYLTISENSSWKLLKVLKHVNLSRVVDEYLKNDKYS